MKINIFNQTTFESRHNGNLDDSVNQMLNKVNASSTEQLISETVPADIRLKNPLDLPAALTESEFIHSLQKIASKNKVFRSFIGMGYYETLVPTVILRNILENPAWYTAYTPYQAEIAQGRLEALINFQTMIIDLTGMKIANASLLDEATAAAEAMRLLDATKPKSKKKAMKFFVSDKCHPQTLSLLVGRAVPLGIELEIGDITKLDVTDENLFGLLIQYPNTDGHIKNINSFIAAAKENNVSVAVASDLLALTMLTPPGEMGADVVFGSAQRLGVPMGYGGPHAAFFAINEKDKRFMPGRVIGISKDAEGNPAYRMALQTREQHIKRERATSNICTAQVLLSVMASMYCVYHGADGLKNIAHRIHGFAKITDKVLTKLGYEIVYSQYFDTIKINTTTEQANKIKELAEENEINLRYFDNGNIGISFGERSEYEDLETLSAIFAKAANKDSLKEEIQEFAQNIELSWEDTVIRKSDFMTHPVFSLYHTEHEMLRYMKRLENKDLSLVHSMISLGSCTMKLNATTEMIPVTWSEFGQIHPFAPLNQTEGYKELTDNLRTWLCEITGFDDVSLQPNSGAQGEYAGLMAIRGYHLAKGDTHRNVAIIPSSAHGTNPASAVLAGMKVVITKCDGNGNIDVTDLKAKVEKHKENLSCLMVTYPSTHGVFEESIIEICDIIHQNGGRVYMDGANMNAQVGLTSPANIGADVCHLNLHKTFCIPHGGGGPGVGPIGVVKDLAPYLPSHSVVEIRGEIKEGGASHPISAAPYGSASILLISYAYIAMMGGEGLKKATQRAILNANYLKSVLEEHYPILYVGKNGRCAHEFILDCREFKKTVGVEVVDIAKRLMDYGFHAPTVSFPVAGTLMIEPTESETKEELDRFAQAMIQIRKEIQEIEGGNFDTQNNLLKNAPHTAGRLLADTWNFPYSRQQAVYPLEWVKERKFWVSVSRIDDAFGDRNLVCSCIPIEEYEERELAEVK
ncbi:glycine dehydrogenase, decarboxylating [Bernardetia litoralis DSM 6794]|uniref:Glycine dehydrogenase (decarboxylating) n=1 Tax=Bernardetia litoralis (strain ATCC 23117 / DSM 6794 / NBRC 15988 / NCIMB 1366 / Fx l1 / Sio-4) TaxID=880071 RepID=I4APB5_BERLS|nr:aminomethyl-transferring glycine dehydrogenase [Bernardetia litoralis]AFM05800.1 glycine dehydrogenase, decarboxylating [Bernardetia litoralis DSM 6794]